MAIVPKDTHYCRLLTQSHISVSSQEKQLAYGRQPVMAASWASSLFCLGFFSQTMKAWPVEPCSQHNATFASRLRNPKESYLPLRRCCKKPTSKGKFKEKNPSIFMRNLFHQLPSSPLLKIEAPISQAFSQVAGCKQI